MNSSNVIALAVHLWQSTLFAAGVGCLTLLLRRNGARVRCLLWLAASAKFLVPFALLTAVGAHIQWPREQFNGVEPGLLSIAAQRMEQITQFGSKAATAFLQVTHTANCADAVQTVVGALWVLGAVVVTVHWYARWRLVSHAVRESTRASLEFVIPVRTSSSLLEPAVVGILRPVLLLPEGLDRRLTAAELHAVLAHERCHVMWKDNLAATLHMLVEALFWFHPLIWWLGARIISERERACDERVLAEGHTPSIYAEGILKVCEHYLGSGITCVAGIGGANLRRRIESIMKNNVIKGLDAVRKMVITLAACATIAVPVTIGLLTSPVARSSINGPISTIYLGPPRAWELRDEVWLEFPDPAEWSRRH